MNRIRRFLRAEDGPTAVEYAVILALIITMALISIMAVGESTSDSLNGSGGLIEQAFRAAGL